MPLHTTARLSLRLNADDRALVERAAALAGTTVAGFLRVAASDKAEQVLASESRVMHRLRDSEAFVAALDGVVRSEGRE